METIQLSSTELIRERLDALEDSEAASGSDFSIWYADIMGDDGDTIMEVEIERLGIKYVNTEFEAERDLELDAARNELAAMQYDRYSR